MDARLAMESIAGNPALAEDESITAFIGPTKNQAKRLIWGRMQTISKQFRLPIVFNATDLIARHSNGAQFWVMGADDDRDVDRLRGFAYRRVIIDEAQAIGADFEDLVDDVLEPALSDYDGDLILTGTPNAACVGFFYRASTGQLLDDEGKSQWATWKWTVLDNPMFPPWRHDKENWKAKAEAWLLQKRLKKGWEIDHPSFQREWLAQWIRDDNSIIYKYDPARNTYTTLPRYSYQHVVGIDFGHDDAFAIYVWAFTEDSPELWGVYGKKAKGKTVSDWAQMIIEVRDQYKPVAMVGDTGALGKAIVKELNQRWGLGIKPAEKSDKYANIEVMNSDFRNGRIHVLIDDPVTDEWLINQWDDTFISDTRKKEDPRFVNDLSDGALYGYREARHWLHVPPDVLPEIGTEAYVDSIANKMKKQRMKEQRRQKKRK